ncbi:hypothetical protein [Subtercola lobariae]|uniref:Uncharacterized protein n=1 Tax=Subtercola lobariae TaxID=1588641 RepID=A0A917BG75_9MICO|nr:hypothetical protein [Subtercola lobariae]GGF37746.1 hypothetical protein GCM10011399_33380 [Subtercola lobariae]
MTDELSFSITDVVVLETYSRRRANIQTDGVTAEINFEVVLATIAVSTNALYVESQYVVTLRAEKDAAGDPELALARTRVGVVMAPSRPISAEEVDDGSLLPSQQLANQAAQPYHRQSLLHLFVQLGMPPFMLPAEFAASVSDHSVLKA